MATRKTVKKETEAQEVTKAAEENPPKVYNEDEVKSMIAKAVADAVAEALAKQQTNVVQISTDKQLVKMLFLDDCSDDNVLGFGVNNKFGTITGPCGYINVPKDEWLGEFRDNQQQMLLRTRKLIVLDGLTDEERAMHGLDYKPGEVLDEQMFRNLLDHMDELPEIFKKLCPSVRAVVAARLQTAYDAGDPRVLGNRDIIVKLNKISKKDFADVPQDDPRREGLLTNIVRGLNKNDE